MQTQFKAMTLRPIKTRKDYQNALIRLEEIFDAKPNSSDGDELEILGILIDNYEKLIFQLNFLIL